MALTTTSGWNTANASLAKTPIYVFIIGGQTTVYTTHDLTKMGITGSLPAFEPWLRTPAGASQSIDVQNGTSSVGELECEVIDYLGAMRTLVGTNTMEGSSATLLVGYPGLAYTDFATLHVYTIYQVIPSQASYTSYLFRSRDVQMDAKATIWNNPTNGYPLTASNPWVLQGTPCEIIQAIWLMGLKNPASTIDHAGMAALDAPSEGLYSSGRPYLFSLSAPFQAKQFIENEILKSAGMYPVVLPTGQYSVRPCRAPAAGASPVLAFTADNVTVLPEIDRADILNDMLWQFDDDGSGNYASEQLYLDATSISQFQRSNERQVQSAGLRTALGAWWWTQEISQRMFARFAGTSGLRGGAPLVSVKSFFSTIPAWVGDYVSLSHPLMPNLFTGALGVTNRIYEVVDRSPDYAKGGMSFKLLDTGLTGAAAAAVFGTAVIDTAVYY